MNDPKRNNTSHFSFWVVVLLCDFCCHPLNHIEYVFIASTVSLEQPAKVALLCHA